ncbi:MAG: DUF4159 domain-containing protein [Chthoniobacterales bacterium]
MPSPGSNTIAQTLIDKANKSRFFTVSLVFHILLVAIFGTTVLFKAVQEPPDFEGGEGGFVDSAQAATQMPTQPTQQQETTFTVTAPSTPATSLNAITTMSTQALDFTMQPTMAPPTVTPTTVDASTAAPAPAPTGPAGMTADQKVGIAGFTGGWGKGKGTGSGTGIRQREFEFVAYLGEYDGGNWDSTVWIRDGEIEGGSLPNLLYLISKWSRDKIKTNERDVVALKLDSDELFKTKPPFIFLTGSQDFKLTEKEVLNLRKYVQLGGAIWGDSSVPGERSRFDIAFRREMRRVIPDVDKQFEPLAKDHPIFSKGYFPDIREAPTGLNFYQEPVYALKIFGEIAILYTANDYGDMWQIGLDENGNIDLGQNERGRYVAVNQTLYEKRGSYIHNLEEDSIKQTFEFGINVITHLLTRWEDKVDSGSRL